MRPCRAVGADRFVGEPRRPSDRGGARSGGRGSVGQERGRGVGHGLERPDDGGQGFAERRVGLLAQFGDQARFLGGGQPRAEPADVPGEVLGECQADGRPCEGSRATSARDRWASVPGMSPRTSAASAAAIGPLRARPSAGSARGRSDSNGLPGLRAIWASRPAARLANPDRSAAESGRAQRGEAPIELLLEQHASRPA